VRKSQEIPELARAFANGEIQITKAKTIAWVIANENKTEWLEHVATNTKFELERKVMKFELTFASQPRPARYFASCSAFFSR
jgi:hypothetical protein